MKRATVDSLGTMVVMFAGVVPLGCHDRAAPPADLQPLVAVTGQYAMTSRTAPKPAPTGTCSNCGAKVPPGGGFVGDGRVKVPCPECNKDAKAPARCDCGCNGKGYIVKPDGSRWACKCPADCSCKGGTKCLDGKCDSTPPTGR
jgi:hypothetical protein